MIRYILCESCGTKFKLHPEDKARGFRMRKVTGRAHAPADHGVTITSEEGTAFEPSTELRCDFCNASIATWREGTIAVSIWPSELDEPPDWEKEFFVSYKPVE